MNGRKVLIPWRVESADNGCDRETQHLIAYRWKDKSTKLGAIQQRPSSKLQNVLGHRLVLRGRDQARYAGDPPTGPGDSLLFAGSAELTGLRIQG